MCLVVLGLSGGLSDDRVGTLSGRRVEDRVVVMARDALATHVVEEQLAELERHRSLGPSAMPTLSRSRPRRAKK